MRIPGIKSRRALGLAAALPLLAAAPVLAQAPAPAASEALPTAGAMPYPAYMQGPQDPDASPGMRYDPLLGPVPDDGKLHGMVSLGAGTNGYRQAAVAITGPLPNGGSLSIAVADSQGQYRTRRRYLASPLQAPLPAPDAP